MSKISFAVSAESIILAYDGRNFRINRRKMLPDETFVETDVSIKIMDAIRNRQLDSETSPIPKLVDIEEAMKGSGFAIIDGIVYVDGNMVNKYINRKIIEYKDEGLPYESLVQFYRNVIKNPSNSSREELFLFLENNGHALTEEGYFLAYKKVRPDFYSIHGYHGPNDSRSVLNYPGTWVECDREKVDPNRSNTCSTGLHVANYDYAKNSYGSHSDLLLEVIVDPKDVVTVPPDYSNKKMRTCRYYVVGPCENQFTKPIYNRHTIETANTNKVSKGDYSTDEEIINSLVDEEIVNNLSMVEDTTLAVFKPTVIKPTVTKYYREYSNAVGIIWRFSKYDPNNQTLTYNQLPIPSNISNAIKTHINKGKLPVTWKPVGEELTGLWGNSSTFEDTVADFIGDAIQHKQNKKSVTDSQVDNEFSLLVGNYINNKLPSTEVDKIKIKCHGHMKEFNTSSNTQDILYIPKIDTRLNHLSQPRINGKFAKKNP